MSRDAAISFLLMRHGETEFNQRHVRCGGDVDIPLTERGESQARAAGLFLRHHHTGIDAIIASPLQRTQRTAAIVQEMIGTSETLPVILSEGLIERRLGAWNGLDIAATQDRFNSGECPPGGEAEHDFQARIRAALTEILKPCAYRLPLLVASKGVARITNLLMGKSGRRPLDNAEVLLFRVPKTFWQECQAR